MFQITPIPKNGVETPLPLLLDDKDIQYIKKVPSEPYVRVISKSGGQQWQIQETLADLLQQYLPNQVAKVTQVTTNVEYLIYVHDVFSWTRVDNNTHTKLNFHDNRSPLVVVETFNQILASYSSAADNFIADIDYSDPTIPNNFPHLIETYNNGAVRITDLSAFVTYLGAALGAPINIANTLFVSTNGNDNTATVGRLDKTWKDPDVAIAAAASGQSVVIFPGSYSISDATNPGKHHLIKKDVSTFAFPGVKITYTTTGVSATSPFQSNTTTRSNGVFKGYATIILQQNTGEVTFGGGNVDSLLTVELYKLQVATDVVISEGKNIFIKAEQFVSSATANGLIIEKPGSNPGAQKKTKVQIDTFEIGACTYPLVVQNNVDDAIDVYIKQLSFTTALGIVLSTNLDCEDTNINVRIGNVQQNNLSLDPGERMINITDFGNSSSGNPRSTQHIVIENSNTQMAPFHVGDCYTGLVTLDIKGVISKNNDDGIEARLINTNAGQVRVNLDVVYECVSPMTLTCEINAETALANNYIAGSIIVNGKTSGDASIFRTTNNFSSDHATLRDLYFTTGADYSFGMPPVAAATLNVICTNSYSNKPCEPAAMALTTFYNYPFDGIATIPLP